MKRAEFLTVLAGSLAALFVGRSVAVAPPTAASTSAALGDDDPDGEIDEGSWLNADSRSPWYGVYVTDPN
jgi:hypothetical protein